MLNFYPCRYLINDSQVVTQNSHIIVFLLFLMVNEGSIKGSQDVDLHQEYCPDNTEVPLNAEQRWYFSSVSYLLHQNKLTPQTNSQRCAMSCISYVCAMYCSVTKLCLFVTPWTSAYQASLSFTISLSLLKVMFIELVMPPNHLILCHPVLLLPSIFPSIRVFYNESALLIKWTKYWSFSFSISPSNEYSELISFRIN